MSELREAVKDWIRAEWLFRFGPRNYKDVPDMIEYDESQRKLRKLVTGEEEVRAAAGKIGVRDPYRFVPCEGSRVSEKDPEARGNPQRKRNRKRIALSDESSGPKKARKRIGFWT